MTAGVLLALAAGALHALGHAIHARGGAARPKGATWAIWAAAALGFAALGLDAGAPVALLAGPVLAAALAAAMAVRAAAQPGGAAALRREGAGPMLCLALAAGWIGLGTQAAASELLLPFLPALAAAFGAWPTLRAPESERPLAWFAWSLAWASTALAVMAAGLPWPFLALPVAWQTLCLVLGVSALQTGGAVRLRGGARAA